jgi:hypothetical protein
MEQSTETKQKEVSFNAGSAANERVALLAALREEMLLLGTLLKKPLLQFPDSGSNLETGPKKNGDEEKEKGQNGSSQGKSSESDPWEKKIRLRLEAIEKLKNQIDALPNGVMRTIPATSAEADRLLKEIEEIHRENIRLAEQARAAFADALSTLHLFKKSKAYLPATPFSSGVIINRQG